MVLNENPDLQKVISTDEEYFNLDSLTTTTFCTTRKKEFVRRFAGRRIMTWGNFIGSDLHCLLIVNGTLTALNYQELPKHSLNLKLLRNEG